MAAGLVVAAALSASLFTSPAAGAAAEPDTAVPAPSIGVTKSATPPSTAAGRPATPPPLLRTLGHADALPVSTPAAALVRRWPAHDDAVPPAHPVQHRCTFGNRAPPSLPAPVR